MNNNATLQSAIPIRGRQRPDKHLHARLLAIRRGAKVRVIDTNAVLSIRLKWI